MISVEIDRRFISPGNAADLPGWMVSIFVRVCLARKPSMKRWSHPLDCSWLDFCMLLTLFRGGDKPWRMDLRIHWHLWRADFSLAEFERLTVRVHCHVQFVTRYHRRNRILVRHWEWSCYAEKSPLISFSSAGMARTSIPRRISVRPMSSHAMFACHRTWEGCVDLLTYVRMEWRCDCAHGPLTCYPWRLHCSAGLWRIESIARDYRCRQNHWNFVERRSGDSSFHW